MSFEAVSRSPFDVVNSRPMESPLYKYFRYSARTVKRPSCSKLAVLTVDYVTKQILRCRVPAMYLTSAFLWFFSILPFRRISKLRSINPPEGFDSHPGHHFIHFVLNR